MEAGRWSVIQTHRRVSPAPCSQRHLSNTTTANSSQFLSKKVFILDLWKKKPKFDFTFIIIKIWLYILICSFLLLVCPQAAITSLSGSHHFLFFLVYVRYLIPSSPLYFVHVQAAWWSFTERWFTRVNTTSRTSPGRSTPSTCLIKRTPPTASRTGGYKTYAKPC